MVAPLKSHVLRREEKGLFGIPFKRLLAAGIGGVLLFAIARLAMPNAVAVVPLGLGGSGFLAVLLLTAQRGGLSLYTRLLYRLRGWLIIAAASREGGRLARLAEALELPMHLVVLDGSAIFAPAEQVVKLDLSGWAAYAASDEDGRGLVFVEEL